jgi:two-component SAPR family response regulator
MSKYIVVIDGSRTIQVLLSTYFKNAGHLVTTFSTPPEALHALTVVQDIPDIIFLFIGYEKHAYDFIAYVKSHAKYARTVLVAMVLQEEKASIQRTLNRSNIRYLVKPFHIQDALALVSASGAASPGTRTREREEKT